MMTKEEFIKRFNAGEFRAGEAVQVDFDPQKIQFVIDPIVEAVRQKLLQRSQVGIAKYGTTMARTDLSELDWLRHAQEEAMDLAVYLERLIESRRQEDGQ